MVIATSGVLGKNADAAAVGVSSRGNAPRPVPSPSRRLVSDASIWVFCAPRASTYSAATVRGALFEKPANAVSESMTSVSSRTKVAPKTIPAGGKRSTASVPSMARSTPSVTHSSPLTGRLSWLGSTPRCCAGSTG